ncbi:hypothetical protein LWM68_28855 [Niabella sp. W65]|nr:hypothetical protein [Niabella sp. W65]MCH7366425.1 hypothetical protein [Niabella sp. W65]
MDSVAPSNPRSLYNDIGWLHNRVVDHLSRCYTGQDFEILLDCLQGFYEHETGASLPRQQLKQNLELMKPIISNQDSFLKETIKSTTLLESYETLKQSVDTLYNSGSSYEEIKSYIVKYESEVVDNRQLSEEERTLLLKTASLARYSIYYWMHFMVPTHSKSGAVSKWKIFTKAFWIDAGVYLMLWGDTYTAGMYSSSFGGSSQEEEQVEEDNEP